jgi:hypothetical protein
MIEQIFKNNARKKGKQILDKENSRFKREL